MSATSPNAAVSQKRRLSGDAEQDSTSNKRRRPDATLTNDTSLHLALDTLTGLLLDKPGHALYKRNVQYAVERVLDTDELKEAVEAPLQQLISGLKSRFTGGDIAAQQRLVSAVGQRFASNAMHGLAKGLIGIVGASSDTTDLRSSTTIGGHKLELRLRPVYNLSKNVNGMHNDSTAAVGEQRHHRVGPVTVDEQRRDHPQETASPWPRRFAATKRPSAQEDSGLESENDKAAQVGAKTADGAQILRRNTRYEVRNSENVMSSRIAERAEVNHTGAHSQPLILHYTSSPGDEAPFQVRDGGVSVCRKLRAPDRSLVLRPQQGHPIGVHPPRATDLHDDLKRLLGHASGLTTVQATELEVTNAQGVRQQGVHTFLTTFDTANSAAMAVGRAITFGQQVFTLEKFGCGGHRHFVCQAVPLDQDNGISRALAVRSLLACFVPSLRLRIQIAEGHKTGHQTATGLILAEVSKPVEYDQLSFEV